MIEQLKPCHCGYDGALAEPVEPAPAQDEWEAYRAWYLDTYKTLAIGVSDYRAFQAGAEWQRTCPAQTEQQPVEVMHFQYRHPDGETHTVSLSRKEVADRMDDELFEKLTDTFCTCEPVGETNVVDCRCDEYAEEFELVPAAPIAQTAPQPEQSGLVEAANGALGAIQDALEDAYHNAYPECCGQAHLECCGSPLQAWSEADQKTMDRFTVHEKALRAALARLNTTQQENGHE